LNDTVNATWNAFKFVCTNFLGNHKAENSSEIVKKMLCFQAMKFNVSLKLFPPFSSGIFLSKRGRI
jgi:hypothetical protein